MKPSRAFVRIARKGCCASPTRWMISRGRVPVSSSYYPCGGGEDAQPVKQPASVNASVQAATIRTASGQFQTKESGTPSAFSGGSAVPRRFEAFDAIPERSRFCMRPRAAKRLRHDFAELPIEITLVSEAGKVNDTALVEHIEPVPFQLWLQQLAHVRLDQDQRDFPPAGSQQPLEVAAKLRVVPVDHKIAAALVVRVHRIIRRIDEHPAPLLKLA